MIDKIVCFWGVCSPIKQRRLWIHTSSSGMPWVMILFYFGFNRHLLWIFASVTLYHLRVTLFLNNERPQQRTSPWFFSQPVHKNSWSLACGLRFTWGTLLSSFSRYTICKKALFLAASSCQMQNKRNLLFCWTLKSTNFNHLHVIVTCRWLKLFFCTNCYLSLRAFQLLIE